MPTSCMAPIASQHLGVVHRHTAAAARADSEIAYSEPTRNVNMAWEGTSICRTAASARALGTCEAAAAHPGLLFAADASLLCLSKTTTKTVGAEKLAVEIDGKRGCKS